MLSQIEIFLPQTARLSRVFYKDKSFFDRERLLGKIVRAELGRAHGRFDRAVAGNHDDLGRVLQHTDFFQDLQPIDSRQPNIEKNDIEAGFAKLVETVFAARTDTGLIAFVLENSLQGFPDCGFVVNNKDMLWHCLAISRC